MMKLNLNNSKILNLITNNTQSGKEVSPELVKMQKSIMLKGALALLTVVLTVVILFAMTSAWYTNIVQTSGLVFEVESWGFSGEITVDNNENIKFAPGDEGTVSITANNESDEITPLTVNVSKPYMNEEMQKRLFFYVDTPMTRNGETMERVYINEKEGYTYNLFGGSSLIINEEVKNAPELKWQWVYDMLGYYVLATPQEVSDGDGLTVTDTETGTSDNARIRMEIEEYLRPIEYDFDKATFNEKTFELETVDGTTTVATFLQELFASDGYSTDENTAVAMINNELVGQSGTYYPVDIDENGHGVYAYLCSYTEIELATKFDTDLGDLAYAYEKNPSSVNENDVPLLTHTAELIFSAETLTETPEEIASLAGFENAIENGGTFKLTDDIEIDEKLLVPAGKEVTIDLGGNTLTTEFRNMIEVEKGGSLTVMNGKIVSGEETQENPGIGFKTVGAKLNLVNVDITGFNHGIFVADSGCDQDSVVYISGCNITDTKTNVFYLQGNGNLTEQKTVIIVENSLIESSLIPITGNGTTNVSGTDMTIINSTVRSVGQNGNVAIYHPQSNSNLTIYNCKGDHEIRGTMAISIKGGNLNIIDSVLNGYGEYNEPSEKNSGSSSTGAAVYAETGYDYEISINISGDSTLASEQGYALHTYKTDSPYVSVKVEQGTFNSGKGYGTDYAFSENWLASGSTLTSSEDGKTVSVTKSGTAEQ